ncbi:MAG: cobalamin biosynthesis protein CbiD, probable [Pseudomonadota bacterium]
MAVPPRDKKGLRTGFTTGACAAAAAKAAARCLLTGATLSEIETTLPNRTRVTFKLARVEHSRGAVLCGIIKDAGDDPDCTHGAEIVAEVAVSEAPGVHILGGTGVATVTKPGLGLEVGTPAINAVPRRNITEMVGEELAQAGAAGLRVTISVPGGEELAKQTSNARLGLLGGISILGTTGVVKPYSTAAYKASVVQAIDVAAERNTGCVVLTTGGKSEGYAVRLHPALLQEAFIQMGDFVGVAARHAARRGFPRIVIVGMIGKLSKMANGKMQTHMAGSDVNLGLLAECAKDAGASAELCAEIEAANTARHVLELCTRAGITDLPTRVSARAAREVARYAGRGLEVRAMLVDFEGTLLADETARDTSAGGTTP